VPFLEQKMHRQVANFALDGGDFDGAARAYLRSAAFKQTPPKLLVWEIPERVLTADLNRHQLD
jgi:alginate O-acetyltransferase complex protein AlgJ